MSVESMGSAQSLTITSLPEYLTSRKLLIAGREALFEAVRMYLHVGQRPDAKLLGDPLWNLPAWEISDAAWIVNPTRGYLTILEQQEFGRLFRLSVLQQGRVLNICMRIPCTNRMSNLVHHRIKDTFSPIAPIRSNLSDKEVSAEWQFDATELYTNAQVMEGAVHRIGMLFESALFAQLIMDVPNK